ncbi:MAG: DUF736 family protein [Donghicola eburneus]|jgi:uncharacterized protein (DUF736 family)|nr:DUF736 family protein [Donghicola eburneus]MCI5042975.1 DUF736 family protein [Donghicola eburneus]
MLVAGPAKTTKGGSQNSPLPYRAFLAEQNSGPLPISSDNPMAPTHRVLGCSPRGRLVECGGIWKKQNRDSGADYFTLTIRDFGFNANLGKAANQDDDTLQAVIPWGPKESQ